MKNFLRNLFRNRRQERINECIKAINEIHRQQARIQAAYDLHRDVIINYGIEYQKYLTPADDIIRDTKPITLINYFHV